MNTEEGADELVQSAMMRPYVRLAEAMLTNQGLKEAVAEIGHLPLEQRYVWRVLSALKWGFADFDNVNVAIDRKALGPEDRKKVAELLQHRPAVLLLLEGVGWGRGDGANDDSSDQHRETGSLAPPTRAAEAEWLQGDQ